MEGMLMESPIEIEKLFKPYEHKVNSKQLNDWINNVIVC